MWYNIFQVINMKDFKSFSNEVRKNKEYSLYIEARLRKELSDVPALALIGQNSVNKIIKTASHVSIDVCLSLMRAYHEWMQADEE